MKVQFEPSEKLLIFGFLSMTQHAAQKSKEKKIDKYVTKILDKFTGENTEIELKKKDLQVIKGLFDTALDQVNTEVQEGQLPMFTEKDLSTCRQVHQKLGELC